MICTDFHQQPPEVFCKKRYFLKLCKFLRISAGLRTWNLIKKGLQHRYFPMKLTKFLRTPISKNTCERLLLGFKQQIFYRHSPSLTFAILYLDIRAFRCIRLQMFWKIPPLESLSEDLELY